jgi:hypothetical protein
MLAHKFKAGQKVSYETPKGLLQGSATYKVERLMPIENGELKYRIKSPSESFERMAKESELVPITEAA